VSFEKATSVMPKENISARSKKLPDEKTSNEEFPSKSRKSVKKNAQDLSNYSSRKSKRAKDRDRAQKILKVGADTGLRKKRARRLSSKDISVINNEQIPESLNEKDYINAVELGRLDFKMAKIESHLGTILGKGILGAVKTLLSKVINENLSLKKESRQNSKAIKNLLEENLTLKAKLESYDASLIDMRAEILRLQKSVVKQRAEKPQTMVNESAEKPHGMVNVQDLIDYINEQAHKVPTIKELLGDWPLLSRVIGISEYLTNLSVGYPNRAQPE